MSGGRSGRVRSGGAGRFLAQGRVLSCRWGRALPDAGDQGAFRRLEGRRFQVPGAGRFGTCGGQGVS
ncbi:MAG: hypothetical protein LBT40_01300 [Deltaproteobacteria bacterium]|nr:hypothetical protein [Deltaproteobacteria bacterium]